ncbi:hypothetical protein BRDID11002_73820 [Bradyrhizobium diazoefficiens]
MAITGAGATATGAGVAGAGIAATGRRPAVEAWTGIAVRDPRFDSALLQADVLQSAEKKMAAQAVAARPFAMRKDEIRTAGNGRRTSGSHRGTRADATTTTGAGRGATTTTGGRPAIGRQPP